MTETSGSATPQGGGVVGGTASSSRRIGTTTSGLQVAGREAAITEAPHVFVEKLASHSLEIFIEIK